MNTVVMRVTKYTKDFAKAEKARQSKKGFPVTDGKALELVIKRMEKTIATMGPSRPTS